MQSWNTVAEPSQRGHFRERHRIAELRTSPNRPPTKLFPDFSAADQE